MKAMMMYDIIDTLILDRTTIYVKPKNMQTTKLRDEKVLVGMEDR
jgi:hypothetical protein